MNKLVLLMERDAELRREVNRALLGKGLEVWPVPDEVSAHQVLRLDGPKVSVAVLGGDDGANLTTLASRIRDLSPGAKVVCCCCGAAENPGRNGCGGVIWPRGADPALLADLVQALVEDGAGAPAPGPVSSRAAGHSASAREHDVVERLTSAGRRGR